MTPAGLRAHLATALVFVSLAYWGIPLTHDTGGRHSWTLGAACLLLAPAACAVRPWLHLSSSHVAVALAPFLAALVVGWTAPTGFSDLAQVASYAYAGGVYLTVRAWADSGARRLAVLALVALVGLEQMSQAWLPWWGSQDVATKMLGTFYWHNQFAAFVGAVAVLAAVAATRGDGLARTVGWIVAPVCACGVLFSASRTSIGLLALCWVVLAARSLRDRSGRVATALLPLVSFGVSAAMTSGLVMGRSGSALATVQARDRAESLSGNGEARVAMWRSAFSIWRHHPLTGGGFGSFRGEAPTYMPEGVQLSAFAHSGPIQAFSDGGVLLGVVMAVACGLVLAKALHAVAVARDWQAVAASLAVVSLSLHSAVDTDWQYPSLLALYALVAGLVPPLREREPTVEQRAQQSTDRRLPRLVAALLLGVVALGAGLATRARALETTVAAPAWVRAAGHVIALRGEVAPLPSSALCATRLVSHDRAVAAGALRCTARAGASDAVLQVSRAEAMLTQGDAAGAAALFLAVDAAQGARRPSLRVAVARGLEHAGRHDAAVQRARWAYARLVTDRVGPQALLPARALLQELGIRVDATADDGRSGGHL